MHAGGRQSVLAKKSCCAIGVASPFVEHQRFLQVRSVLAPSRVTLNVLRQQLQQAVFLLTLKHLKSQLIYEGNRHLQLAQEPKNQTSMTVIVAA